MREMISQEFFDASWLLKALSAGGMGIWLWDLETGDVYIDAVQERLTGLKGADGLLNFDKFMDRVHAENRQELRESIDHSMATSETLETEFQFKRADGKTIWLGARGDRVAFDGQNYKHFAVVNWDATSMKMAEEQAEYVAREMAHRVKNIIAMIAGISRMTARASEDLDNYMEGFHQRLTALAGINQYLLSNEKRLSSLEGVVRETLLPVDDARRINIETSDFEVNEQAAQTLVLALNELVTNAIKYGALEDTDGSVDLKIIVDMKTDMFKLIWHEKRSRAISPPPEAKGFGSQVLLKLTKATFKGNPKYHWHSDGLTYTCEWSAKAMAS